jgi:fructose-bisphosphate aldolase class II
LIDRAVAERSAVLGFNVITLEYAEGIVSGASRAGASAILQISENAVRYHGHSFRPLLAGCREIAAAADVPIAIHLDHVEDETLADDLIGSADLGIGSIMLDASTHDIDENVARTARATRDAHAAGLWVEAELGRIGGKDGAHAPGVRTDPAEAAWFAEQTGVDGLAVAVGSSHAMHDRSAALDFALIAAIADVVPVPLVLHGSSGVPDEAIREAVDAGIRKVNVGTALNIALTGSVREVLAASGSLTDSRRYLAPGRDAIADTVAHFLGVLVR